MFKNYLCRYQPRTTGSSTSATSITGMAETHTISNSYMAYIKNQPYQYPPDNGAYTTASSYNTGYHIIPNFLWRHFVTPKQWYEMQIKYEAYHVESCKATVFNMIPLTTQLAIQGTNIFTSFNNTVYCIGYTDDLYETSWVDWAADQVLNTYVPNLAWKEGQRCQISGTTKARNELPVYLWNLPHTRTTTERTWGFWDDTNCGQGVWPAGRDTTYWPSGVFWDPLNRPDHIQELRPGKNAISYRWECHPCDEHIWYNLDQLASWYPWTPTGPYHHNRPFNYKLSSQNDPDELASRFQQNPWVNDYTIPNLATCPLVASTWWWKEMQNNIAQEPHDMAEAKTDMLAAGTEYEQYKYPPTQWFLKIVPIFDTNGTLIEITANVSIQVTLTLKCKPRRSAIYAPTWGPMAYLNTHSARTMNMNFIPSFVRYRTGGARRGWQNLMSNLNSHWSQTGHPRQDPYMQEKVGSGTGIACTFTTLTTTTAKTSQAIPMEEVTYSDEQLSKLMRPKAPAVAKRRVERVREREPNLPINDPIFQPTSIADTQL
uniref:VP n=1 Tax=Avian chapparvovirus TaxID=2604334 RepID=A0A7D4XU92_9VIRU|nr:VP [Avian chapparvovirus]